MNWFVLSRIAIGALLCFSGGEKLLSHYQNFLYVIQGYQFLPMALEEAVARIFPWLEFIIGLFLLLGLWVSLALRAALAVFTGFIAIVGQALIRELPIKECGCFGEAISLPPQTVLLMDSFIWLLIVKLLLNTVRTSSFSLDQYFEKNK